MVTEIEGTCDNGSLSVGIVQAKFNEYVTGSLLEGAVEVLEDQGVRSDNINLYRVPGAYEIPGTASRVLANRDHDGLICLGAVIRGETPHFEYISSHVSDGIGRLSMEGEVPVIFGVLTTDTRNQALQRARSTSANKGVEAAESLLQTIKVYNAI